MPLVCGIYGYEITRPFTAAGLTFVPRFTKFKEATNAARNSSEYVLTGTLHANTISNDHLFALEAVLSFVEHYDVVITSPRQLADPGDFSAFPSTLSPQRRHNGGGAVIGQDTFFSTSRADFVTKSMTLLNDARHCEATGYRQLFFKATETFRQREPFIEVSYFLLFSGLETYARKTFVGTPPSEVAQLLAQRLKSLGLHVYHFSPTDRRRSMDTYARLRNALFHRGEFEAHRTDAGVAHTYKLMDYFANFRMLVDLVILKATAFDDGHINWNSWIDRQPFK